MVLPVAGYGVYGFGYGVGKADPRVTRFKPYARVTAQNEGLQRKAHASFMRGYCAPGRLHREAEKSQTRFLKEKGVITDSSREMT